MAGTINTIIMFVVIPASTKTEDSQQKKKEILSRVGVPVDVLDLSYLGQGLWKLINP